MMSRMKKEFVSWNPRSVIYTYLSVFEIVDVIALLSKRERKKIQSLGDFGANSCLDIKFLNNKLEIRDGVSNYYCLI